MYVRKGDGDVGVGVGVGVGVDVGVDVDVDAAGLLHMSCYEENQKAQKVLVGP